MMIIIDLCHVCVDGLQGDSLVTYLTCSRLLILFVVLFLVHQKVTKYANYRRNNHYFAFIIHSQNHIRITAPTFLTVITIRMSQKHRQKTTK